MDHYTNSERSLQQYAERDSLSDSQASRPNTSEVRDSSQRTVTRENLMSRLNRLDFIKTPEGRSTLASGDLSAQYRGPKNKKYIFLALLSAILLAMSQTIRGVASYNIFSTKFTLSLTYLVCSSLYFIFMKVKAKRNDEVFYAPWYTAQLGTFKSMRILLTGTQAQNEVFVFNSKIFKILLFGGICEFSGSTLMLFSYRAALASNINQGICSSMLSMTSITVTIASYAVYRERVHGI